MSQIHDMVEALKKKGGPKLKWKDIDQVKEHPKNPRFISDSDLQDLVKSITDFPDMMRYRPGIEDADGFLIAGNQRLKACKRIGWEIFPVMSATDMTPEQLREFMIKDNISFGEWDTKALKAEWKLPELRDYGMDVTDLVEHSKVPGEHVFSTELDQESNFVVLKFNKDIDWAQALTMLGLQSVYSKRANGKPWSKGVGRVIDGPEAIKLIQKAGGEQ